MARRGGGAWRVPGNPMAGVMRDAARQARKGGRRPAARGQQADAEPWPTPAEASEAVPLPMPWPVLPAPLATIAVTDASGHASWTYSEPFATVPVLTATVQDVGALDGAVVFAVIEEADHTAVTVRVWRTRPVSADLGAALVAPAGPGVEVHLTATPVRP